MENYTYPPPPPRIFKMIKDGTLPFDIIAHDLFVDVVLKVKRFWSAGYKLFNERFVRYMGGYKNKGEYWLSGIVFNLLL